MSEPVAWMIRLYDISAVGYHDKVSLTRDPVLEDRERFEWIPLYAEPSGVRVKGKFPKITVTLPDGDTRKARVVWTEMTQVGWDVCIALDEPVALLGADPPDVAALRAEIERLKGASTDCDMEALVCRATNVHMQVPCRAVLDLHTRAESAEREVAALRAKMEGHWLAPMRATIGMREAMAEANDGSAQREALMYGAARDAYLAEKP